MVQEGTGTPRLADVHGARQSRFTERKEKVRHLERDE